eukprot:TRINITY_DN4816_c0_g1_i4.p1 TRINITY_DN4816_c0_g1~~TRINITY_DN4816_c0_g1_i4.p1  ORF type:complete len:186 (+),score=21.21 TRINITY_DN4816_c0_g1_i4:85-642(+)
MTDFPPPKCISDLLQDLVGSSDARFESVSVLFSVSHDAAVKAALRASPQAMKGLIRIIEDISKRGSDVRWEALATLGELCRRDHQVVENRDLTKFNNEAEATAISLVETFPTLQATLQSIEADQRTPGHEIAQDLLQSLPFPGVTGWKTKAKDLLYLDGRLEHPWFVFSSSYHVYLFPPSAISLD